mgnify:CR=1 FL=1
MQYTQLGKATPSNVMYRCDDWSPSRLRTGKRVSLMASTVPHLVSLLVQIWYPAVPPSNPAISCCQPYARRNAGFVHFALSTRKVEVKTCVFNHSPTQLNSRRLLAQLGRPESGLVHRLVSAVAQPDGTFKLVPLTAFGHRASNPVCLSGVWPAFRRLSRCVYVGILIRRLFLGEIPS